MFEKGLRARLSSDGFEKIHRVTRKRGKFEDIDYYLIDGNGLVSGVEISMDGGNGYISIPWGSNGLDIPLSPGLKEEYVDGFECDPDLVTPNLKAGEYLLRNGSGHIQARGLVVNHPGGSRITVTGDTRAAVVKLTAMIKGEETAPEAVGGRRGLIRDLRSQIASLTEEASRVPGLEKTKELMIEDVLEARQKIANLQEREKLPETLMELLRYVFTWRKPLDLSRLGTPIN